ncbi:hypothetical protein [Aureliella helgolandensis]|nr:hypothetical protein [Aureliella helgolandensis]
MNPKSLQLGKQALGVQLAAPLFGMHTIEQEIADRSPSLISRA